MRCICALLVCTLGVQGESSQVATSYEPRSQTFEGLKQQRLEKSIDGHIKKFKAEEAIQNKPVGLHGHSKHSSKRKNTSNPFLRDMDKLLNGTVMANITLRSASHNMNKREVAKIVAQSQREVEDKQKTEQAEHVEIARHLTNESAPASQVAPTKKRGTFEDVHQLTADINTTAKELNLNISQPAVDKKMAAEPKNPTRAETQKENTKIFGESPGAWKRERQTERMQKTDLEVQKQMDQIKKHSTSSQHGAANHTVTKDVQQIVADANATAKELNINISHSVAKNDTIDMKMLPKPKTPTRDEIQKANSKVLGESPAAWRRESQTEHIQKMDRDVQKQMDEVKNHGAVNHTFVNVEVAQRELVDRMARHVQELNMSMMSNMSKNNQTNLKS